ncbi:MAG: TetR/AcrR family transcriptional regulator [Planctomycetota bacterium]
MTNQTTDSRLHLLKIAKGLFFSQGYSSVSTDMLAREAGVSKSTIYKHFQSMSGLFDEVVRLEIEYFETGIDLHSTCREEFVEMLIRYGVNLMRFLNKKDVIQLDCLMLEEARDHPENTKHFFEKTYEATMLRLGELIEPGIHKAWIMHEISAVEAAEMLIGMWKGSRCYKAQFRIKKVPFRNIESWSKKCVRVLVGETCTD